MPSRRPGGVSARIRVVARSTDPAYIRRQKLDILVSIATEKNAVAILDEL